MADMLIDSFAYMNRDVMQLRPPHIVGAVLSGPAPQPCPEVMTEQEAVKYLRLDLIDIDDPAATLNYYRRKGLLRGTQIGKCVRYRRVELERFLDRITEENPR